MTEKIRIEKNTVQETLIIPLYARVLCTKKHPDFFKDEAAVKLLERIDYDFAHYKKGFARMMYDFEAVEVGARQNDIAVEINDYLKTNPYAAVVNLGCGLDATGRKCYNGKCKLYNLDYPDVIEARNTLLPAGENEENIPADLNDVSWFDKIDCSGGAIFFASGVFYYFTREEVFALINKMAEKFKGGKIVFDAAGKAAVKSINTTILKSSEMGCVATYFYVNSVKKDVIPYLKSGKASQRGYMLGYDKLKYPSISALFRLFSRIADNCLKMKIVRIDFKKIMSLL